jgi:hypothetical protein
MFQLGKTLVSEEILEENFVCNLSACKGECCIAGDAGAPLDKEEAQKLEAVYPQIKAFLRPEGIAAIEQQGAYVETAFSDLETPLINNKECAYVVFDETNTALCGIEAAHNKGVIDFKKPISCHLYPIRIKSFSEFTAINYHRWDVCAEACSLGKELQVPVFRFLKDALTRKFGENWFLALEKVAAEHSK